MDREKEIELMQSAEERQRAHLQRWLQNSSFRAALKKPAEGRPEQEPSPRKVA